MASSGLQRRDGLRNCIPVSFCVNTGNGQFMALTNEEGHNPGEIFWPSPDRTVDNFDIAPMRMHHFLGGSNFAEWLITYADQLSRNCYPIIKNEIFKFLFSATTTTQGITVTTTTAFLPELSSVKPPLFFFTYRISISMGPECSVVSVKDSCICCYCALLCKCFLKRLKVSRHSPTRCKGFFAVYEYSANTIFFSWVKVNSTNWPALNVWVFIA